MVPGAAAASPPPPAAPQNTITLESSPEFQEVPGNVAVGSVSTWYYKTTFAHGFGNGFGATGWFQNTFKIPSSAFPAGSSQQYYEVDLAYRLAVASNFSVTVTRAPATPPATPATSRTSRAAAPTARRRSSTTPCTAQRIGKSISTGRGTSSNARYRNAFELTWITPKVYTGLTYTIDPSNAVFANIGYSWKDNGSGQGLLDDKLNIAFGYKFSF